jgi:nicotinamide-nucleotide amidase
MEIPELKIVGEIRKLFLLRGLTLAVSESCTGGLVSHMLTSLPGISKVFDSAIVCYSSKSKHKLLGVDKSIISTHGTISEETARAMAEGVEKKTGADVGLAITGNLGPEPEEDKKTGLVYIAVSSGKETTSRGFIFDGDRQQIKQSASEAALHFLFEAISAWT